MIPVGLLVIAPNMGQHALDDSVMTINNATMWNMFPTTGNVYNDVKLTQTSMGLTATMHEGDFVMHIPAAVTLFATYNATNLGYFEMPEETIEHGDNHFT